MKMAEMPTFHADNWFEMILLKLVKSGYGSVPQILETPTDIVVGMLHYESFVADYERQFYEINKPK